MKKIIAVILFAVLGACQGARRESRRHRMADDLAARIDYVRAAFRSVEDRTADVDIRRFVAPVVADVRADDEILAIIPASGRQRVAAVGEETVAEHDAPAMGDELDQLQDRNGITLEAIETDGVKSETVTCSHELFYRAVPAFVYQILETRELDADEIVSCIERGVKQALRRCQADPESLLSGGPGGTVQRLIGMLELACDQALQTGRAAELAVCQNDRECDDGLFCNGTERCEPGNEGADLRGCVVGALPCGPDAINCTVEPDPACDEDTRSCRGRILDHSFCGGPWNGLYCHPTDGCVPGIACNANRQCPADLDGNPCTVQVCNTSIRPVALCIDQSVD